MADQEYTTLSAVLPISTRGIGPETLPTVNGRDLHAWLGVQKYFSDWMKVQIKRAKLFEHMDFEVFHQEVLNPTGGRPGVEYALSLDAAKRIAMMSSADKGHEVRLYFLECEKRAQEPATRGDLLVQMAEAYRAQEKRLMDVEAAQQSQALQLIEQQASVIAHLQLIVQANEKADTALQQQQWITLREYVFTNKLSHQFPPSRVTEYGKWLAAYCLEKGIPVRRIPIADRQYDTENGYHVGTIEDTLPGWLKRRNGQGKLEVVDKPQ